MEIDGNRFVVDLVCLIPIMPSRPLGNKHNFTPLNNCDFISHIKATLCRNLV